MYLMYTYFQSLKAQSRRIQSIAAKSLCTLHSRKVQPGFMTWNKLGDYFPRCGRNYCFAAKALQIKDCGKD